MRIGPCGGERTRMADVRVIRGLPWHLAANKRYRSNICINHLTKGLELSTSKEDPFSAALAQSCSLSYMTDIECIWHNLYQSQVRTVLDQNSTTSYM